MEIEFDPAKYASNRRKHGVSLSAAARIDWRRVRALPDGRMDYGEERHIAAAVIDDRLHVVVFTVRATALRIISLRRANRREIRRYEAQSEG